jgi:hypothetical protein
MVRVLGLCFKTVVLHDLVVKPRANRLTDGHCNCRLLPFATSMLWYLISGRA